MLIGFDASRAFVAEATGTENYSLNLLRALAKADKQSLRSSQAAGLRKNRYRVYLRVPKVSKVPRVSKAKKTLGTRGTHDTLDTLQNWPSNFEFKVIRPNRLWTQLGLAWETWRNPVDLLFVPAHTLPILRKRTWEVGSGRLDNEVGSWNNPTSYFRNLASHFPFLTSKRTKYVVTIHDLGVEYLPGYHQFPQRYYLDFASRYAARHADAVIAVSGATKADLVKRYNVAPKKVFVVHEGVDTSFFRPRPKKEIQNVKIKYQIDGEYILFVGTIQPRKNLEMLIEAFSRLVHSSQLTVHSKKKTVNREPSTDNCQLVLAGKLGWDFDDILAAPKKLGIESLVKFLGHVPTADLPALYSGAKVFVFPSLFEGFGLPILEALACGCPVVASDIAPHREIFAKISNMEVRGGKLDEDVGSEKNPTSHFDNPVSHFSPRTSKAMILVKPTDVDKWTEVLYQYISQYENRKINISKNGQIMTRFSWQDTANKTLEVFERVLR